MSLPSTLPGSKLYCMLLFNLSPEGSEELYSPKRESDCEFIPSSVEKMEMEQNRICNFHDYVVPSLDSFDTIPKSMPFV